MVGQELVEAELSQYHSGMQLADVIAGRYSPRHVLALLRFMPPQSRTAQVMRAWAETLPKPKVKPKPNPLHKYLGWGPQETWSARVVEQLRMARHEYAQSVSTKKLKSFEPMDIPGSADDKNEKRRATLFELARQNHLRLKEGA